MHAREGEKMIDGSDFSIPLHCGLETLGMMGDMGKLVYVRGERESSLSFHHFCFFSFPLSEQETKTISFQRSLSLP